MHDLSLISTVAAAFTSAWLLGLLTQRLGLSPIVGYLLAGVLIGRHTPGFVGDEHVAAQLAEVGVILLMFGVGLHFHLKELLAVQKVAVPGAVGQSAIATIAAIFIFGWFGLPMKTGAVLGMAMAVASTVVLIRVLSDADMVKTPQGHIAVGWLIVEDVFTVILLVLIPVLGQAPLDAAASAPASAAAAVSGVMSFWKTLGTALLKLAALVAIVLLAGSRVVPWVLVRVARLRSRELFTLTVLVFSIAIAAGSYFFFGASMALGAFLAGMVVAQSPVSHQAAADALPMRDAFAVLFFVSVGMLFDPSYLVQEPLMILAGLGIVLLVKPLTALVIVAALGHSSLTALTVAVGLAQIGEFSFILSELARQYGLMTDAGHNVLVASAMISITLNPMIFRLLPRMEAWLKARPRLWRVLNRRAEELAVAQAAAALEHNRAASDRKRTAIVVGYGPVGRSVHRLLRDSNLDTVVIDLNVDTVSALRAEGQRAIYGDAANDGILEQAGVREASHLVLTLPQSGVRSAIVAAARSFNRDLRILVRARYLREREDLEHAGATAAVFEEAEAAVALARLVLADTGLHRAAAERKITDLRLQLITENLANIRSQRVRSVMVPWARVRWISSSAETRAVLATVSQERFSRWPVVDLRTNRPIGYLFSRDLIARAAESDWLQLVRPLKPIHAEDTIETTLTRMQSQGDSIYVVEDGGGAPAGIITLEDILEQVVGQIEDEYPHEAVITLGDALRRGATIMSLSASTIQEAIRELVTVIPEEGLPPGLDREAVGRQAIEREGQVSTDLGNGVAIPHARCPNLPHPMLIFGRSEEGLPGPAGQQPVHILFLLITPSEQPEAQLSLLAQIAGKCRDADTRDQLIHARSPADVAEILQR
jgi:CPA2 family monovalent cation:H+ antiporter-2